MTVTAVGNKVLCLLQCVLEILCFIHCKYGRKLFVGEFLAELNAFNLADKDFGSFGNVNPRKLGDFMSLLTYNLGVKRTVDDDGLSDLFGFGGVKEIAAAVSEFFLNCVVNFIKDDNRLLGCANHTVIERF